MDQNKIKRLFESENVSGFLTLKKTEIDDQQFIKLLSIKPSEINIILARVVSFVKGDETKTKRELINDILEVLERSAAARQFVGIGVKQEYQLFKGFPVRKGDPYESMPEPNSEMTLQPTEVYIGWTTDNSAARQDAVKYDASKGEPIGGLLIDVHVDVGKVLFDVNAVIQTVKTKYPVIQKYNEIATPGKSLSKTNTAYLANEASLYKGNWEIVSTNKVINVRTLDKWVWDTSTQPKKIKWTASDSPKSETEPTPEKDPQLEVEPQQQAVQQTPQTQPEQKPSQSLKERLLRLFENEDKDVTQQTSLPIFEDILDEALWQGVKNFMAKAFGTIRGKKLKYLQSLVKFYELEKEIYELAADFSSHIDKNQDRVQYSKVKLHKAEDNIVKTKEILRDLESGINIDDIPEPISSEEPSQDDVDMDAKHARAKKIRDEYEDDEDTLLPNKEL